MRLIDADVLLDNIRHDSKKAIDEGDKVGSFWLGYAAGFVIKQPTIQPEHKIRFADKDHVWIDGKQYISLPRFQEAVKEAQPKEGYWIDKGWNGDWAWQIDGRGNCWRVIECSECGKGGSVESNYCPHCGAKMTISK